MKNWLEVWVQEDQERKSIQPDTLCKYGIGCLDDSLGFINKNDLVVIGADSGIGKSELALHIGLTNVRKGKTVAFYFLEGGERECIQRIKWRLLTEKCVKTCTRIPDYKSWVSNMAGEEYDRLLDEVGKEMAGIFKDNLYIYPISEGLSVDQALAGLYEFHTLENCIDAGMPKLDVDLVIIDHINYFELSGKNEFQETTAIIKRIKEITDLYGVPVVLVSHLRKRAKDRGVPDQEDFFGTSNIPKISSTSITITLAPKADFEDKYFPTIFRVVKDRRGMKPFWGMVHNFDSSTREYSKDYALHIINREGFMKDDALPIHKHPKWAVYASGVANNDVQAERRGDSNGWDE
jgi:hypothetical protein